MMKDLGSKSMMKDNNIFKFMFLIILILINIGLVFLSNNQFRQQKIYNEFIEKKISILTENPNDINVQTKDKQEFQDTYFISNIIYGENSKELIDSIEKPNILTEDYKQCKIEQYESWKNLSFSKYLSYYYPTKKVAWEIKMNPYTFDVQSGIYKR